MEILSLGEKLKRKRKELNMTLKDLAGDRITPGQISLVESGKSNPSMDLLEYLANALNTSIEYLMESEETQAEKICTFFETISEAHIQCGDLEAAEQYIEKALFYAEKYNLEYRKAKNLYLRGTNYMERGEVGQAQQFFLSANVIFIKHNCFDDIINTFLKLGIISLNLKAYHSAYSYFKQAEKVFSDNDIGNDFLLGEIYYFIAFTYHKLENHGNSVKYAFLARQKFDQLGEKKEYAMHQLQLAKENGKKGYINSAIKYSRKALSVLKEINDTSYMSGIENNLGKLFYEFKNMEESFALLNKSKQLREKNKDPKIVETLINICENYIALKDVQNSRNILKQIIDNVGNESNKALIDYYMLKYRVDSLEGNPKEAENTLLMALDFVSDMDYKKEQAEISIILGKFYIDNGKEKEASEYLSKGVEIYKSIGTFKDF